MTMKSTALLCPFDAEFFADPYPTYARLRADGGVHQVETPEGSPIWLITRERDVRAGLSDPRLSVNKAHSAGGYRGFSLPPALDANLLNVDHADHLRLRRLVSKAFTPRRVEQLRGAVAETTQRLADAVEAQVTCDLAAVFAQQLPTAVIGELLAVPAPNRAAFSSWAGTMLAPETPSQALEAINTLQTFLFGLVAERRSDPGDDLLSDLIAARDEGDRLTENELVSLAFLILVAGSEELQHVITNGLLTLLRHPDQLEAIRTDPALLPDAVEEIFRYAHSNQMAIRRFPLEDIEIGGVRIPRGQTVMLGLASANRDPERYPEADRFDIRREDKSHLTLGHGLHYCLGAALGRLEVQAALSTLLTRFPRLRLTVPAHELRWRPSWRSHALLSLPITVA